MYKLIRPLLFSPKDPETAHNLALVFLKAAGKNPIKAILSSLTKTDSQVLNQKIFGMEFKHPVGLAGGFDKNAEALSGLEALGFSFLEMGTITKVGQPGNPRPRMFRFFKDGALINRMGFNNLGADAVAKKLSALPKLSVPLGVSFGKSKIAELKDAAVDYLYSFEKFYNLGDYFAVNVSSPNTPGLRQLQDKSFLIEILAALNSRRQKQAVKKPLLVKIAPDLEFSAIDEVLEVCNQQAVDGVIATNTTISRQGLSVVTKEAGGLSGRPLKEKSTAIIRHIHRAMPNLPIIGVGGFFTAQDAYEKIKAGASLVQIYTGFIYEGPFVVKKINQGLIKLLERDGFKNISGAVGKGL